MNFHKLEVLMVDRGIKSIPKLAEQIGISKKTLYSRFHGQTDFTNSEIKAIKTALRLSDKEVISIFFCILSFLKETLLFQHYRKENKYG